MDAQRCLDLIKEQAITEKVPIIGPEALELLLEVVRDTGPSRILEIGSATGYSAINILMNAPVHAEFTSIELDASRASQARTNLEAAGLGSRAKILCGNAANILLGLDGPFDFVFIDAAKGHYLEYLKAIEPKLMRGAVIVADNVLFRGYLTGEDSVPKRFRTIVKRMREYLDYVTNAPAYATTIYQLGDGVAVSRRGGD